MKSLTREEKLKKIQELERQAYLVEGLPHLFGRKLYKWASAYIESSNRMNLMCAANQISKSSTNIRKCIKWATSPELWPKLWPSTPKQFWYMYPSQVVASQEFAEKWVKEWLPRGDFKDHPVYGWVADIQQKKIVAIRFNSGVTVYFRSYEMKPVNLQTSSVHAIFADEEMPEHLYSEIIVRTSGADILGHFHMVFTATLGQEFWRQAIEGQASEERFPDAFKQQISMYDCQKYMDGSPGPWTTELIEAQKRRCKSQAEIDRRIYGKFVLDEGLKYPAYSGKNYVEPYEIPHDWLRFSGVDVGSGGKSGHPAAIVFVAVRPDFKKGVAYMGWRGDGIDTTAGDILQHYRIMRGKVQMTRQFYDWQSKDFWNIATRIGEAFEPAEKSHAIGEQMLNVLFKNRMLDIFVSPELRKLHGELKSLKQGEAKTKSKDDLIDALRYAITKIPWDFSCLDEVVPANQKLSLNLETLDPRMRSRLGLDREEFKESLDNYQAEFDEANDLMGYDW